MTHKVFLDTNILVYLYDLAEDTKQARALKIVESLVKAKQAVISPQVLAEFFVATTRPARPLLSAKEAYGRIQNLSFACTVVDLTRFITLEAIRGVQDYQFSFWDAQIWAAARLNQIAFVFSEDFSSGSTIEGVHFINPLADDFQAV